MKQILNSIKVNHKEVQGERTAKLVKEVESNF